MAVSKNKKQKESPVEAQIGFSVEVVEIETIHPAPNNTKKHTAAQVDAIVASIKEFGFNDPIAVDQNGEIIEGHGRRMALLKMGATKVPVIRLNSLDEAQVRAYRIAHNKTNLMTGFDMELLAVELGDLAEQGFDINCTGFSSDDLLNMDFMQMEDTSEANEEPVPPEKPKKGKEAPALQGEAGEEGQEAVKATPKSVVQYILIFEDEDQQAEFYTFLKYTRDRCLGDTVSARVMDYISKTSEAAKAIFGE